MQARSYLYTPGHREKLIARAFELGADVVIFDLEDAVPPESKGSARGLVREALQSHAAWIRINDAFSPEAELDLALLGELAAGIRIPKVESGADVRWVHERAPEAPLCCLIESARGVLAAPEIARAEGAVGLGLGAADLQADLGAELGPGDMVSVRLGLAMASRAADLGPPVDTVYPRLADLDGLRREAELSKRLGFFGKSAIHPSQVAVINDVFAPSEESLRWARQVTDAHARSGGNPTKLDSGEFVDKAVAKRAKRILGEIA